MRCRAQPVLRSALAAAAEAARVAEAAAVEAAAHPEDELKRLFAETKHSRAVKVAEEAATMQRLAGEMDVEHQAYCS